MFELRRLDVWPVDDLGVRQGYGSAWRLDPPPSAKQLAPLGERFRPYRSIVARYCWAAVALFRGGTTPPFGSSVEAIAVGRRRRETAVSLVCLMY
jgi:DNA-3-methyladenine glycosylase II